LEVTKVNTFQIGSLQQQQQQRQQQLNTFLTFCTTKYFKNCTLVV
jgi:predicted HicB family RNase H-like nuclease